MWIVAPYDVIKGEIRDSDGNGEENDGDENDTNDNRNDSWAPHVSNNIETASVQRLQSLARLSLSTLVVWLERGGSKDGKWGDIFKETKSSLKTTYDVLFKVNKTVLLEDVNSKTLVVEEGEDGAPAMTAYSKSLRSRNRGLKVTRKKANVFKNLTGDVVLGFNPVDDVVRMLRAKFGSECLFCYNELVPDYVGLIWKDANKEEKFNVAKCGDRMLDGDLLTMNVEDVTNEIRRTAGELFAA